MKTLYTVIFLLTGSFLHAQIVNIPDVNFKNALIEEGIDANGDGEIQVSEAEAVLILSVGSRDISSLEGIQSFINLEELYCSFNQLSELDLSQNVNLQRLDCKYNQLTDLNVTQNINLNYLWCQDNFLANLDITQNINLDILWASKNAFSNLDVTNNLNLTSLFCDKSYLSELDVSQNLNLESLVCSNNQLISLDVSQNINLTNLLCSDNQLTSLFINNTNNHNMSVMLSTGNIDLNCIQIDDENATYPECGGFPVVGWCKDEWSSYSEDCSLGLTELASNDFSLYPNPAKDKLFVSARNTGENSKLKIFDLEGKLLITQNMALKKQTSIDVSKLTSGIYFLSMEDGNGNREVKKFIKE